MARGGNKVTSSVVIGALLCLGLFLLAIAAAVILSLISTFTSNQSQQGYGSEYSFDAIMLKFLYDNSSGPLFNNGTAIYSAELSQACTQEYANLGTKHLAGCVLYNGAVYAPYNTSNSTRRRRQTNAAGMYYVGQGNLYLTTPCTGKKDINKTDNSTGLSACVKSGLAVCNSIINRGYSPFILWSSTYPVAVGAQNTSNSTSVVEVSSIYGIPSASAATYYSNLNISSTMVAYLQRGCRYVGPISMANIATAIGSVPANSNASSPFNG